MKPQLIKNMDLKRDFIIVLFLMIVGENKFNLILNYFFIEHGLS